MQITHTIAETITDNRMYSECNFSTKGSHFGSCHSKYNYTLGSRIKLTVNVITVLAIVITAVKQSSKLWKKTRGELKLSGRSPGELYLSVPQKSIKSSSSFN